jgi:predicted  nucleic acid-binding Zn-ribbon protein
MRWILAVLALLLSGVGSADPQTDAEIQHVESQLQRVQQEQQSLYQQFQMIQELRRTELQAENPQVIHNSTDYSMANPPPNYDDLVREKTGREYRIKQYTDDLNRVYARYSDLDAQRKLLLDRLNELTLSR